MEAKRYRLMGGPFYLARTEHAGRVAIEQQSQQDFWSIGWCTLIAVLLINQVQVQLGDDVHDEPSQVVGRKDILQSDLEIKRFFVIGGFGIPIHAWSLLRSCRRTSEVLRQTAREGKRKSEYSVS